MSEIKKPSKTKSSKSIPPKNWWDVCRFDIPRAPNSSAITSYAHNTFSEISVKYNLPFTSIFITGVIKSKYDDFINEILSIKDSYIISKQIFDVLDTPENRYNYIFFPNAYLSTTFPFWGMGNDKGEIIDLHLVSNDDNITKLLIDIIKKHISAKQYTNNACYVMQQTSNGVNLVSAGNINSPLIKDNYEDHIINDYNYILSQLNNKKNPNGRITIFNGPPGTGKTYLIRSLISEAKDCIFVIVPSGMISSLMGPNLISPFLNIKEENKKHSIVLILEDADNYLLSRDGGNMNEISSLLNFGDGILGALFDIRIIASTNGQSVEIDDAIKRPGRLCRHTTVGPLSKEKANKVFERLTGESGNFSEEKTLAEVYQAAQVGDGTSNNIISDDNTSTNNSKTKKIGFTL